MKIIQTFVAAPILYDNTTENYDFDFRFGGFPDKFTFLAMWLNSFYSIKNKFGEIHLYGDIAARHILIDVLKLNYNSFTEIESPDFATRKNGIWSWNKIKTYSLQEEAFLHIDGDIIINRKAEFDIQSDFFFEFPHNFVDSNIHALYSEVHNLIKSDKDALNQFGFLFEDETLSMMNFGFFGGKNFKIIKEYSETAMSLAEYLSERKEIRDKSNLSIFIEQIILSKIAKKENTNYSTFVDVRFDREVLLNAFLVHGFNLKHLHTISYFKVLFKKYIESRLFYEHRQDYNTLRQSLIKGII